LASNPVVTLIKRYPKVETIVRRLKSLAPMELRLGRRFWWWYAFFRESETWSEAELAEFQMERLRGLLHKLRTTSAFYHKRLEGVDLDRLQTPEDFKRNVAPLSRKEFAAHLREIRAAQVPRRQLSLSSTSGTTGLSMQFYHRREDAAREWAAICHQWSRVGFDPAHSRRAEFRGLTPRGTIVQYYPDMNMVRCSILDLEEEKIRCYADVIRRSGAKFFHGYPSAIYLLARKIAEKGLAFPQPEAVLLASETVYPFQLDAIKNAFPTARIYAHYGCAERTVLAGWCEYRQEYHVLPQYSLVEVDPTTKEIIGTNLYNDVNGFVRYRMADVATEVAQSKCPDCGRPYLPRLTALGGRMEDYLFSAERGWIAPAIVTYPLKNLRVVEEIQFHQEQRDAIRLRYTVREESTEEELQLELRRVLQGLNRLFGAGTRFDFERVNGFARGPTGKFKWIVCELIGGRIP
jgi:phenylacetate-coenzyme A ligase PaaK-like adenylate-forming protein